MKSSSSTSPQLHYLKATLAKMSFMLNSVMNSMDADPEKVKLAEIQFEAMNLTFNT